ncbi:MAG TPA: hypothetical protein VI338_00905, partial [Nitrososphaera sp.]|nr:hypothetical protein [Nitrososphaera sp.]
FFGSFAIIIGGIYWVWNAHDAQQHGKQRFLSENPNLSRECGECHGTGKVRTATTAASMYSPFFASKCPTCNGIGYIPEDSVSL